MKRATTTTLKLASLTVAIAAAAFLASCSGDDGAVGPAGKDGTNGTNGTNGVGFDDAVSKGNVIVYLEGTRPDGVAFKDTLDFRYAPSQLDYNQLYRNDEGTDLDNEVRFARYTNWDGTGIPWEEGASNTFYSYSERMYSGSNALQYEDYNFELDNASITFPKENKYFNLNFYGYLYNYYDETGAVSDSYSYVIENLAFSDYKKTIGTDGKFNYKATFTVAAGNNSSGNDLKVTVVANVNIVEVIQGVNKREGRVATQAKNPTAVKKAEMLPLN